MVGLYHAVIGKGMKQHLSLITDFALKFQGKVVLQTVNIFLILTLFTLCIVTKFLIYRVTHGNLTSLK